MNPVQPKRNHLIIRDRHVPPFRGHASFIPPSTIMGTIPRRRSQPLPIRNAEVVVLNGDWVTNHPHVVTTMHNLDSLQVLQNGWIDPQAATTSTTAPSPRDSDSGIEIDCDAANLSWLLNYKIHELPPVPDTNGDGLSVGNPTQNKFNEPRRYLDANVRLAKVDERVFNKQENSKSSTNLKKPPFTYTELIEHALNEKGELTVSGIYQWITDHFPFYKQNDDRWKNSVRHNLSINPHFRKGSKAVHGAGHLWTIAQHEERKSWCIKQRMQQFMQNTANECNFNNQVQLELEAATASILPDEDENSRKCLEMFDDNRSQNIEIEYVNVIDMTNGLGGNFDYDFLCPPVSKEEVAEECGLGDDYLITDLNPNALGLNLTDAEIINSDNLYDDLNFHCYDLENDS